MAGLEPTPTVPMGGLGYSSSGAGLGAGAYTGAAMTSMGGGGIDGSMAVVVWVRWVRWGCIRRAEVGCILRGRGR